MIQLGMALNVNPVENHREREKGVIIYPVYSRRSQGLSIGINLFPNNKVCNFDCPYCEVFPFNNDTVFSIRQMEEDLRKTITDAKDQNIEIKDICFSGNGEPSLSPHLFTALPLAAKIRDELCPPSNLVLISNGTGLLKPDIFSFLKDAATASIKLDIWLKLDAATPDWYKKINRSSIPFEELIEKIKDFVSCSPVIIQTMLCSINSNPPSQEEEQSWLMLVQELINSGNVRKIQIYGKARPAPEDPLAQSLPIEYLEQRAASLPTSISVEIYP